MKFGEDWSNSLEERSLNDMMVFMHVFSTKRDKSRGVCVVGGWGGGNVDCN